MYQTLKRPVLPWLEQQKQRLEAAGFEVEIEIPHGLPMGCILERARKSDTTLVPMEAQGRGSLSELFLGSVAHNVARHAQVPVLFVRRGKQQTFWQSALDLNRANPATGKETNHERTDKTNEKGDLVLHLQQRLPEHGQS